MRNYAEKMTMRLMGEINYNYGNQPATSQIARQIIADTKAACIKAIKKNQDEYKSTAYTKDSYIHDIKKAEVKLLTK